MSILRYLFGYLIIKIHGEFCEQLLNVAAKNRIQLWSLRYKKNSIIGCISINDFKKLRTVKRGIKIKVKIIAKRGLPFYIARYNRRIGFFVGAIVFIAVLKFLSSFIWIIDIVGIETLDRQQVLSVCENIGIYEGVRRSLIDTSNDAKRLTLGSDKIAWSSLNIEGSVLTVNITEIKDNKHDLTATNIKAVRDGKITKIDVTAGNVVVKVGDTVSKGDLLVSGISETSGGTIYIRSSGYVYAKTTHTYTAAEKFQKTLRIKNGDVKKRNTICFFGLKIPLYIGGIRGEFEQRTKTQRLNILGSPVPIYLIKNEFEIIERQEYKYSKKELNKLLKKKVNEQIAEDNITDFEVLESSIIEKDGGITYTLTVQTVENIALAENLLINTTN